jgi:hypothetical protein
MRPVRSLVLVMLVGCGSAAQKPAPARPDPKAVAAALDGSLQAMQDIVHRLRGDCTATAKQLVKLFAQMRRQISDVRKLQLDPDSAADLKLEMDAYAANASGRDDAIAADLTACAHDPDIMNVMSTMPEL